MTYAQAFIVDKDQAIAMLVSFSSSQACLCELLVHVASHAVQAQSQLEVRDLMLLEETCHRDFRWLVCGWRRWIGDEEAAIIDWYVQIGISFVYGFKEDH